jgi:dTDP-glucose 4,6-dehydratase/UDP-glucuronate decarboxylase
MDPHHKRDSEEIITNLDDKVARFAGKRVLLTGAAGFLGSQFVHFFSALNDSGRLGSRPCRLIAWDSFGRGKPAWISALGDRPEISWQSRNVIDHVAADEVGPVDFIIHAASIASPIFYRKHPLETMDANVMGLRNLLDVAVAQAAATRPLESFLFFSSSEIYGDPTPENIPTPETYWGHVSCTGPRACYDESKRYGETLCVNFAAIHKVPVKTVRPFNNYGPGLKISDRRVLPDFFRDALAGRDITLLSDGRATRTFCYGADAVTGYLLALLSPHDGEAFNIGTERPEVAMRDLASMVAEITGNRSKVRFAQSDDAKYTTDNPQRRCPRIDKARRMLAYSPRIELPEGLDRTFRYYVDNRVASDD